MRQFDWGARAEHPAAERDRVLTIPNIISVARLAALPVFAYLVIAPGALGWALALLMVVAFTDWVDGFVARRFDQVSRLGRALDPLVDRALMATVGVTLVVVGMVPWWLVVAVVVRDVALLAGAGVVFRGIPDIPVTRVGKTATASLLVALPGFLIGHMDWVGADLVLVVAWMFAALGLVTYYVSGVQYVRAAFAG